MKPIAYPFDSEVIHTIDYLGAYAMNAVMAYQTPSFAALMQRAIPPCCIIQVRDAHTGAVLHDRTPEEEEYVQGIIQQAIEHKADENAPPVRLWQPLDDEEESHDEDKSHPIS